MTCIVHLALNWPISGDVLMSVIVPAHARLNASWKRLKTCVFLFRCTTDRAIVPIVVYENKEEATIDLKNLVCIIITCVPCAQVAFKFKGTFSVFCAGIWDIYQGNRCNDCLWYIFLRLSGYRRVWFTTIPSDEPEEIVNDSILMNNTYFLI